MSHRVDRDEALEGDTGGNISCSVEGRGNSRSDLVDSRLILVELVRGAPVNSDYPRHECGQHASCLSSHFPIVYTLYDTGPRRSSTLPGI